VNEKWRIINAYGQHAGKGYAIQSVANGMVLDIKGGLIYNEASVIIWPSNNQVNQLWFIIPA